ncbi:MAG: DNA double-strand break repair nuclease NurA [Candidatus Altiarchaeota archaeon]|nr:DNA double-strand break repair nuclease NurA [Candidatus Altiarchaeota archaeon]
MERLSPDFRFDVNLLENKLKKIADELGKKEFDRDLFRDRFTSEGFRIGKLKPSAKNTSFLSVDSSVVKKELRHNAIWGSHSVVLYSEFDGKKHPDPLAQGIVHYTDIMYDSHIDVGVFSPYGQIDSRMNSIRVAEEYSSLLASLRSMGPRKVDLLLIDGSLYTTLRRLRDEARLSRFPEHKKALELHDELMGAGKVVGLVEDSHSSDLSKRVGLEVTNTTFFESILEENEYVATKKAGVNVCHIKLPSKALSYTHSRISDPLVVRWEFSYDDFMEDLSNLVGLWLLEDDIWHPQIYPMRITDYLTRRLKIGSVLDSLIAENELDPKYRDLREA